MLRPDAVQLADVRRERDAQLLRLRVVAWTIFELLVVDVFFAADAGNVFEANSIDVPFALIYLLNREGTSGRRVCASCSMHRMAGISPIGCDWDTVGARLRSYRNAVVRMDEWDAYQGLHTRLGAPAAEFALSDRYNRKTTRSMGRVALMATRAVCT